MELHITENHLKILTLFTHGYFNEYYIREVYSKVNIGLQTAQRILDDLEKKGILSSHVKGKIRNFKLKNNQIAREFIILTEQYKKIILLKEHLVLKEIVEKLFEYIHGPSGIFGSYAKGTADANSDLDIFIIGKCDTSKIDQISTYYSIPINVIRFPSEILNKDFYKDNLMKEILNNHVLLTQQDEFVRKVL